jgi:type VI secretion system protein ImpA
MSLDLESLLQSFGEDEPSGEDLEYDPDFIALELAAQPKEEHQVGDSVIAGEEPDYKEVKQAAVKVMERAHDLRAAVYYANAALRSEGLPAFAETLAYMRGCLEQYWPSCHPQLDPDDNDDPTARANAVAGLADNDTILRALRAIPLTDSRMMGRFGLREIQIARGEAPGGKDDAHLEESKIASAFKDTPQEHLAGLLSGVKAARDHLKAIEAVFDEKVPAQGPDLSPLSRTLFQLEKILDEHVEQPEVEEEDVEEAADEAAAPAGGAGGEAAPGGDGAAAPAAAKPRGVGQIATRKDVLAAMDRICEYYEKNEPSSPVPVLIRRAQKLVVADFEAIMRDLAPSGLDQWQVIKGSDDESG